MDSTFKPPTNATTPHRPSKRLLFDRRYGLVIDEWEDPSEVALAGGRGIRRDLEPLPLGFIDVFNGVDENQVDYLAHPTVGFKAYLLKPCVQSRQTLKRANAWMNKVA